MNSHDEQIEWARIEADEKAVITERRELAAYLRAQTNDEQGLGLCSVCGSSLLSDEEVRRHERIAALLDPDSPEAP